MPNASSANSAPPHSVGEALLNRNRFRILGLTPDDIIKYFFNGNAVVAIVVLALITVFLFREGVGFFGQNLHNLRLYRLAGLEYVDFIRHEVDEHTALTRAVNESRLAQFKKLTAAGKTTEEANAALASFDAFANAFGDSIEDVRGMLSDLSDAASAIKTKAQVNADREEQKAMLLGAGKKDEADKIEITPVNFAAETGVLKGTLPAFRKANDEFATKLGDALQLAPRLPDPKLQAQIDRVHAGARDLIVSLPKIEENM
jgi:phosphate transport system permease protein